MSQITLVATPRTDFGKGAARRLRREGQIPAVVYGNGSVTHISVDGHELLLALKKPKVVLEIKIDGATLLTKPRDVQRDVVKRTLEHVDLLVMDKGEAKERMAEGAVAEEQAVADAAAAAAVRL